MSALLLTDIIKRFGTVDVLHGVSLTVADGEFVVFVGPSGCGKSTLLRIIAGLEAPSGGDILIDGARVNEVAAADRGLAMVFQSYALYPHMSVRQNLAFGLENSRMPRAEIASRVAEAARMLRIEPLLARKPRQLSGGQRQRVAIGRAIVRRPGIFLLDEPLSNLDAELRVAMRGELATLHKRLAATMIYVTHDQVEAMTMADRIVVLRAGRIEQVGAPLTLYNRPANRFVAGFLGAPRMNFLAATVTGRSGQALALRLADGSTLTVPATGGGLGEGAAVSVGIRPQHLSLGDGAGPAVEVALVEHLGNETIVHARSEALGPLILALPGQAPVRAGDGARLAVDPGLAHVFGEDEQALPRPG
jgi:multiple sugar transport system ATP-binding protein